MTVIDVLTIIGFIFDILFVGITVGRYIEQNKNDRPKRKK